MFMDFFKRKAKESESVHCKMVNEEMKHIGSFATGEVVDVMINPITGERTEVGHYHNLIVDTCSILIAGLMKGDLQPLQYIAVGSGSSSWNNESLPNPLPTDTKLLAEVFRKQIAGVDYIDTNNVVTTTKTNKIQIKVLFLENEANGELRELGVFGGNATTTKDTGIMVNRKIHPLIYKTSGMQLERTIRFTF